MERETFNDFEHPVRRRATQFLQQEYREPQVLGYETATRRTHVSEQHVEPVYVPATRYIAPVPQTLAARVTRLTRHRYFTPAVILLGVVIIGVLVFVIFNQKSPISGNGQSLFPKITVVRHGEIAEGALIHSTEDLTSEEKETSVAKYYMAEKERAEKEAYEAQLAVTPTLEPFLGSGEIDAPLGVILPELPVPIVSSSSMV
jgi:hypothetical protein